MRAAGYMAKRVKKPPDWLRCPVVQDIYSISNCISENFADYISFWKHNGYWFFDSPALIREVAAQAGVSLDGCTLFYYEAHELEFDQERSVWQPFDPERDFTLDVKLPASATLEGYDVVSFYADSSPECSPLSCNGLARDVLTNRHALFGSFVEAIDAIERGVFRAGEPGPLRAFAVHTVAWNAV